MHISTAISDLSFKALRADVPERLAVGTKVQFLISGNTDEDLDGEALKGDATVLMHHRRGTVFEFEDFKENDFNRLCVALRPYIDELPAQNG